MGDSEFFMGRVSLGKGGVLRATGSGEATRASSASWGG